MISINDVYLVCGWQSAFFNEGGRHYSTRSGIVRDKIRELIGSLSNNDAYITLKHVRSMRDNFWSHDVSSFYVGSGDVNDPVALPGNPLVSLSNRTPDITSELDVRTTLKTLDPRRVILIGARTHLEILFSAQSIRSMGFSVSVKESCCFSEFEHLHNMSIALMADSLGVDVTE